MPDEKKPTNFERLEHGLKIDEDDLDQALIQQPQLFYEVARMVALETSERDSWKQDLAECEARADAKIRHDLEVMQEKVRETDISNRVMMDKAVQNARGAMMACTIDVGKWTALKEAYTQRSYMLKDLVTLYVANYYDSSNSAQGTRSVRNSDADKARQSMSEQRQQLRRRHG